MAAKSGARQAIEDVTTHRGFTGTIKTLANLYDQQHAPESRGIMTCDYEGERISYSYFPPRNAEQLLESGAISSTGRSQLRPDGRYPEFVAELIVGLLDWSHIIEKTNKQWAENARAYHRYVSRNDLVSPTRSPISITTAPSAVSEQEDPDLILHIVGERKEGAVVRGLRTLATLAPIRTK